MNNKTLCITLLVCIMVLSEWTAFHDLEIASTESWDPNVTEIEGYIPASSLQNALLGNTSEQPYFVYLPSSYNASNKRYPVVYFLHGFSTTVHDFRTTFVANPRLDEMIVVLVNGQNTVVGGSFYTNSPITGNWEDFVVRDVVQYIDSHYRTLNDSAFRGIGGFSMGGYGALAIAMQHPNVFGAVYSISPGLFDPNGLQETYMYESQMIEYILDLEQTLSSFSNTAAAQEEYLAVLSQLAYGDSSRFTLAYGSAFTPNVSRGPPFIDYAYHNESGTPVRDNNLWEKWENGFGGVADEVTTHQGNLRQLKGIGIEYGQNDGFSWIPKGCEYFAQQLAFKGISYQLNQTVFGHADFLELRIGTYMLSFFSKVFEKTASTSENNKDTIGWLVFIAPAALLVLSLFRRRPGKISQKRGP